MQSDQRNRPLLEVLNALHEKFGANLKTSEQYAKIGEPHRARANAIWCVGKELKNQGTLLKHQTELATCPCEIFSDLACATYFAYCGLDVAAKTLTRRALELGVATIVFWDDGPKYWGWRTRDEDLSFADITSVLSSSGYVDFLANEGCEAIERLPEILGSMKQAFKCLSNVVHPKYYNFETTQATAYSVVEADLHQTVSLIDAVERDILCLFFLRFPRIRASMLTENQQLVNLGH